MPKYYIANINLYSTLFLNHLSVPIYMYVSPSQRVDKSNDKGLVGFSELCIQTYFSYNCRMRTSSCVWRVLEIFYASLHVCFVNGSTWLSIAQLSKCLHRWACTYEAACMLRQWKYIAFHCSTFQMFAPMSCTYKGLLQEVPQFCRKYLNLLMNWGFRGENRSSRRTLDVKVSHGGVKHLWRII